MIWLFESHRQAHYEHQILKQILDTGGCRICHYRLRNYAATITIVILIVVIFIVVFVVLVASTADSVSVTESESVSIVVATSVAVIEPESVAGAESGKLGERFLGQFVCRTKR